MLRIRPQILRYTEPDHPDHASLTSALATAERTLTAVNEAVRSHEDDEKLAFLSDNLIFPGVDAVRLSPCFLLFKEPELTMVFRRRQRLDLTAPTTLLGRRRILKEGQLSKAKSGRKLNAFLFNDLLLFTETRATAVSLEVVYRWVRRNFFSPPGIHRFYSLPILLSS